MYWRKAESLIQLQARCKLQAITAKAKIKKTLTVRTVRALTFIIVLTC